MNPQMLVRRRAMRQALELRRSLSIAREESVNAWDIANAIGIDIWFKDLPSLEGMFTLDPHPVIILPSLKHRPKGRVLFTCAHEIGHYKLGHPPTVDERSETSDIWHTKNDNEIAADAFAASLLLPRQAILHRLANLDTTPERATPIELFQVATELGVGYNTLLTHMRLGLELVNESWHKLRKETTPKQIREEIIGDGGKRTLNILCESWPNVPLELEVDDVVAVPQSFAVNVNAPLKMMEHNRSWQLFSATKQGQGHLVIGENRARVRVTRRGFCGQFKYRYLEDDDE